MSVSEAIFTTGEFATLCGVKKQTLFHYDEIGILQPEYRNDKGYRYYSLKQLEIFSVIEILKDLQLSLTEIKTFLDDRSVTETIKLLEHKAYEIDRQIKEMEQLKLSIQNRRQHLIESNEADFTNIEIVTLPESYYLLSESVTGNSMKETSHALMRFIRDNRLDFGHPIGALLSQDHIMNGLYDDYQYFYIKIDYGIEQAHHMRAAGQFVVAYHEGHDDTIYKTHKRIKAFLKLKGYQIDGDSYEEYVVDEVSTDGPDKYVTKICIPVKQNDISEKPLS
ncbi:MerR family transcriptional regulator [Staphylococcus gallinarum]|uniref:MerR family transcriptional regulator n=1 Tax=Staphylococcus gallinarum TaxID=1293 RepID=UPI002442CE67|nr:MerR family transcriptional regulator [Staphylococcus gallinarum]MEB7038766.1 MerR family transcriptional regulator [Staphylococcus gallinarum]